MPVNTTYPGVYIQELPSGVHTIAGVSTSVAAFVGAAQKGPVDTPVRVFNFAAFTRTFGGPLGQDHPMAYAVQHFFANGGSEAVIVRAAGSDATAAAVTLNDAESSPKKVLTLTALGKGGFANKVDSKGGVEVDVDTGAANPSDLFDLAVTRREPNARTGEGQVVEQELYRNLSMSPKSPRYVLNLVAGSQIVEPALASGSVTSSAKGSSVAKGATSDPLTIKAANNTLRVSVDHAPPTDLVVFPGDTQGNGSVSKTPAEIVSELNTALAAAGMGATASQTSGKLKVESNSGGMDSAVAVVPAPQGDISQDLKLGLAWGGTEVSGSADLRPAKIADAGLAGGTEGSEVTPSDVVPSSGIGGIYALSQLRFPRFNLMCLPDLTSANATQLGAAMAYCKQEHAFLLVDSPLPGFPKAPPDLGPSLIALGDHGAIYYPRLKLSEQLGGGATRTLSLPATGAVAGVMARTDTERGIWKAPAGLAAGIVGVDDITQPTDDTVSGQLNPNGINVLRKFPGAGIVVWGARTLKGSEGQSTDFKYVPIRRLTDYIESSLYLGTQFAVFEPNDPDLWGQLRLAVTTFMRTLFRQGAFQQSAKRDEASSFFVTCDETVNPQSEVDLGRVNVVVGFAPLKPAEFIVLTITQISHLEA